MKFPQRHLHLQVVERAVFSYHMPDFQLLKIRRYLTNLIKAIYGRSWKIQSKHISSVQKSKFSQLKADHTKENHLLLNSLQTQESRCKFSCLPKWTLRNSEVTDFWLLLLERYLKFALIDNTAKGSLTQF